MENFAFYQFVEQIYLAKPALKQHDELVRQFLRDELKGRKSFVVDETVVAKAQTFVDKRTHVTKVGDQLLQNDAMLFQEDEQTTQEDEAVIEVVVQKEEVVMLQPRKPSKQKTRVGVFFLGFFLGGLIVGAIFVYNFIIAPTNELPVLF